MNAIDSEAIKQQAIALGFHKAGIATVPPEMSEAEQNVKNSLRAWLAQGYQADMAWMQNPKRQNVRALMPEAASIICVALNYYTDHQRPTGPEYAKIARYGWGRDYHRVMTKKLKQLLAWLRAQSPHIVARFYTDTGPMQDKFWAQQAGIGWNAKNGNVISREYGSWIFLGEIITNLDLTPDRPHTAHCGSCNRCLDACPTEAIREPGVVDANRCIAYHTIENREEQLPDVIAPHLQNWVAGCDICQDVCPWNQRFAKATDIEEFQPYPGNVNPTLRELAHITDAEWQQRFPASALRRIKPDMLRRNASVSIMEGDGIH
ncbi:MAG: tRNA epoxyqueuosine(34) reductase QueG [Cyanobacteria bacterium P01_D01_bin.1]